MAKKVDKYLDLAKEHKKTKAENEKKYPEAISATPTMEKLIAWADKHEERVAKVKTGKAASKVQVDSAKELENLGFYVEDDEDE